MVFPHLEKVLVEQVVVESGVLRITARTRNEVLFRCPDCGTESRRVHSRYQRHLADAAVGGRPVVIELTVRRLFCDAEGCPRRTFAEQVEGLTTRYCRYTPLLLDVLRSVGLALAGSAGARLLDVLQVVVSRVTLLSLVLALPEPAVVCPRILGVDEFALKRSYRYSTVLVDVENHTVVDILSDYSADALAAWLTAHPGAEVICRDRANCFSDGARRGAPQARQCADRWHLWNNLGGAVERSVARLKPGWLPPEREPAPVGSAAGQGGGTAQPPDPGASCRCPRPDGPGREPHRDHARAEGGPEDGPQVHARGYRR
ncbi:ISL3 family transposase [Streptomyces sp. NPDC001678]|uniref:ISL3 family transposase n=1 Tax=Streptomyces sp. NPDC001678 TaxID=3364599 RepID=UPI00367962AE